MFIDFQKRQRARGAVPLDADGDMLLFQWGPNRSAEGAPFEVGLTRPFILSAEEDEDEDEDTEMFQLSPTYSHAARPDFDALEPGNRWFRTPAEAAAAREAAAGAPVTRTCARLDPLDVLLRPEQV